MSFSPKLFQNKDRFWSSSNQCFTGEYRDIDQASWCLILTVRNNASYQQFNLGLLSRLLQLHCPVVLKIVLVVGVLTITRCRRGMLLRVGGICWLSPTICVLFSGVDSAYLRITYFKRFVPTHCFQFRTGLVKLCSLLKYAVLVRCILAQGQENTLAILYPKI